MIHPLRLMDDATNSLIHLIGAKLSASQLVSVKLCSVGSPRPTPERRLRHCCAQIGQVRLSYHTLGATDTRVGGLKTDREIEMEDGSAMVLPDLNIIPIIEQAEEIPCIEKGVPPEQQFDLIETIGKGSCGSVYLYSHIVTQRLVAIKRMSIVQNRDLDEIRKEIQIMQQCRSRYIVSFYGECWLPSSHEMWIVMEYCEGGSVGSIMHRIRRALREIEIVVIVRAALSALQYLHHSGKIHRDIKPDNILINHKAEPKLADFGITMELSGNKREMKTVMGTPYFLAPEILEGEVRYNDKVDIWALGISIIEMAEQYIPHGSCNAMRAIRLITTEPAPRLSIDKGWSSEFQEFVSLSLTKDPVARASASDLLKHPFLATWEGDLMPMLEEALNVTRNKGRRRHASDSPSPMGSPQITRQRSLPSTPDMRTEKMTNEEIGSLRVNLERQKIQIEAERKAIEVEKVKLEDQKRIIKQKARNLMGERSSIKAEKRNIDSNREEMLSNREERAQREAEFRRREEEARRRREREEEEIRKREDHEEEERKRREELIRQKGIELSQMSTTLDEEDLQIEKSIEKITRSLAELQMTLEELSERFLLVTETEKEEAVSLQKQKEEELATEKIVEAKLQALQQQEEERLKQERESMSVASSDDQRPQLPPPKNKLKMRSPNNSLRSTEARPLPDPQPSPKIVLSPTVSSPTLGVPASPIVKSLSAETPKDFVASRANPSTTEELDLNHLPPGWATALDPKGRRYFIDHTTRMTHWKLPDTAIQWMNSNRDKKGNKIPAPLINKR
ncbi:mitogen-activated protein kinase kinase kinase kinase [Planoprotostelium fungivorum]|uniref:non-specific serine/threonine protein kinase n=1 Tax=Planoprotostelium fungivorum TaxID=1890364 RepID=A0A2P6MZG9_9EUKA|nr:mitogen-activated protein kinase kinase kinase kinase [Planoprotostelium fungivorum]